MNFQSYRLGSHQDLEFNLQISSDTHAVDAEQLILCTKQLSLKIMDSQGTFNEGSELKAKVSELVYSKNSNILW